MDYSRRLTDEEFKTFLKTDYSDETVQKLFTYGLPDSQMQMWMAFQETGQITEPSKPDYPVIEISHAHMRLEKEGKFFISELRDHEIHLNSSGRERVHKPKTKTGQHDPDWEIQSLAWKKFREGYRRALTAEDHPLLLQIPCPEHLDASIMEVCPTGNRAAVVQDSDGKGSRIHLLDLETGNAELLHTDPAFLIRSLKWVEQGEYLVFTPQDDSGIQTKKLELRSGGVEQIAASSHSTMGAVLDVDASGTRLLCESDGSYQVLDLSTGSSLLCEPQFETMYSESSTAFSPCGQFLFIAAIAEGEQGRIIAHDLQSQTTMETRTGSDNPVDGLVYSSGGLYLLERFSAPSIWAFENGQLKKIGEAKTEEQNAGDMQCSPSGKLVSLYTGGRLTILDASTGETRMHLRESLHLKRGVARFLNNESQVVMTGGGLVSVCDITV